MKEPTEEIRQCLSFILLAREKIFVRAEICLETIGGFCNYKNRVVKITYSSSEMVLLTTKYTMIYPGSGPFIEAIALHPAV
jgi:hypothetical protein